MVYSLTRYKNTIQDRKTKCNSEEGQEIKEENIRQSIKISIKLIHLKETHKQQERIIKKETALIIILKLKKQITGLK